MSTLKNVIQKIFDDEIHPQIHRSCSVVISDILKKADKYDSLPSDTDESIERQMLQRIMNEVDDLRNKNAKIKKSL